MKKISISFLMIALMCYSVFAGCPCNEKTADMVTAAAAVNATQERLQERIEARNLTGDELREQIRERVQEFVQSENMTLLRERIHAGLENALTRVENENARQRLQTNLERFQERYQERIQRFENLTIDDVNNETGAVRLRAKQNVRFLGFIKGRATKRFNIDENGNIREKAPWYRFLYREVDEEETAEE
jgi:hypothetical protein